MLYGYSDVKSYFPVDTEHKLNVHKTFRRRPGRLLYVQFTSSVYGVGTLDKKQDSPKGYLRNYKDLLPIFWILVKQSLLAAIAKLLSKYGPLSIVLSFLCYCANLFNVFVIYLRIDKSYTIYLKLISIFPNSQITVT